MSKQRPRRGHPRFFELCDGLKELHSLKSFGYGTEKDPLRNLRASEELGVPAWRGVVIRMGDKWFRLVQLTKSESNDKIGESIVDTLRDLAAYALDAIVLYEEANR